MQQYKSLFQQSDFIDTKFNIQRCLRMNDYSEIGDSTHYLVFDMLGMFSFRELSIQDTIRFWIDFMYELDINISYVTLHPECSSWKSYYPSEFEVCMLEDNIWSDGNIGGYCTEFFVNDIEIGNIVNPLSTCIDVGFGLQRLLNIKYNLPILDKKDILLDTCNVLLHSGVKPGSQRHGYILRKLLIDLLYCGGSLDHQVFIDIKDKQLKQYQLYKIEKTKNKHKNKTSHYWLDTYGIDETNLDKYKIFE